MSIFNISNRTLTEIDSFNFAVELGLISLNSPLCTQCDKLMHLERGKIRHQINNRFRCSTRTCRKSESIFKNTIFEKCHLNLSSAIRILYLKAMNLSITDISIECNTKRETISKFLKKSYKNIRNLDLSSCFGKLSTISDNSFIEIDETHFVSRRDNRGRILRGERYWVLGAIQRNNKCIRLKVVRNRNHQICEEFINNNIEQHSNIVTDMWRGYNNLNNYNHYKINHSIHFVDPDYDFIHTQNIERLWLDLKKKVSQHFSNIEDLIYHVKIFEFEKNFLCKMAEERFNLLININKV